MPKPVSKLSENEQLVLNAVPEQGEIRYADLFNTVRGQSKNAINSFHPMRRAGVLSVRLAVNEDGEQELIVSRPAKGGA